MSDSRLYSRLLLPKGHGYPLFHPQPFDDLPLESRRVGTDIGDVGVVTSDGSFDVIFNVCRAADDPINRFGVPGGFEQIYLGSGDVAPRAQYHGPGSDISNARISKRRLDVDAGAESNVFLPLGAGAVVEISTSSKEAAVLLLPNGASRADVRRLKKFRDYALKHAQHWYAFVNGDLERMVESGDLYLVTGTDKSSSWSLAAIAAHSEDFKISLKLKAAQVGSAGTSCAWEWENASSFADSGPRRRPGEEEWTDNQTVFLRGFKVAIRSSPLKKSAKALSIVDSKPSDILSKSGFFPFSQLRRTSTGRFFRNSPTSGSGGASDDKESADGSVEFFPGTRKAYHPASAINEYLLNSSPTADVAVTHDDEWASVLSENDGEFPDDSEIIRRISRKYNIGTTSEGVWLQDSETFDVLMPTLYRNVEMNIPVAVQSKQAIGEKGQKVPVASPYSNHFPSPETIKSIASIRCVSNRDRVLHYGTVAATLLSDIGNASNQPYLQAIASVTLLIMETVQRVRDNKDACMNMTQRTYEIVCAIINICRDSEADLAPAMVRSITQFSETLEKILVFVRNQAKGGLFRRMFRSMVDADFIKECNAGLKHALDVFGVQSGIIAAMTMAEMQKDAKLRHEKLIAILNEKRSRPMRSSTDGSGSSSRRKRPSSTKTDLTGSLSSVSMLPASPKIFYGRDNEIQHLTKSITLSKPARIAICGAEGLGKTTLALAASHSPEISQMFGVHRYFVECEGARDGRQLIAAIAAHLNLEKSSRKHIIRHLSAISTETTPVLLVLDALDCAWKPYENRNDVEDTLSLLSDLMHLTLMVTFRGSERPRQVRWTRPFFPMLQALPPSATRSTFLDISDVSPEEPGLEELLEITENNPGTVTHMAILVSLGFEGCSSLVAGWQAELTTPPQPVVHHLKTGLFSFATIMTAIHI
ncbi:hypothetical protein B0H14DRAFT_2525517 [Mycena olivaceomarginata]|nr:hypothetical protein B0H14DRAFT_2525517 [Mycena olivaceomarginata]